jgi:hypothetical protein
MAIAKQSVYEIEIELNENEIYEIVYEIMKFHKHFIS